MISDINELVPAMRPMVSKLISEAAKIGLQLRVVETYRTPERQAALYAQGRTKPGAIVTNAKPGESYHEKRRAVDVVDRKKGYNINWDVVGQIGTKAGLVWGGPFGDKPHFEYHGPAEVTTQGANVTQREKDIEKVFMFYQAFKGEYPPSMEEVMNHVYHVEGIEKALRDGGMSAGEADIKKWHQFAVERARDFKDGYIQVGKEAGVI